MSIVRQVLLFLVIKTAGVSAEADAEVGGSRIVFRNTQGHRCTLKINNDGALESSCPIVQAAQSDHRVIVHSSVSSDSTLAKSSAAASTSLQADFLSLTLSMWRSTATAEGCRSPWFVWESLLPNGAVYSRVSVCFDNTHSD